MVRATGHHLRAGVVKDDHTEDVSGLLVEREELTYLELMGDGEGCPPLVDECIVDDFPGSHPPVATSVAADNDVGRDGTEPVDEFGRDWDLVQGQLKMILRKC
jgi:hypothetical protein